MSILSSIIVLALLYFSFHACNARRFGVVHNDPTQEFQYSTSKKNHEKLHSSRVSIQPDQLKPLSQKEDNNMFEENKVSIGVSDEAFKNIRVSALSVSWRVQPQKQRREDEEAGFSLDYLPPRTHPPVHN